MATTRPLLAGLRVLELTVAWAGPFCGKLLAGYGAQVIKIEAPHRPDLHRGSLQPTPGGAGTYPQNDPGEHPWNRAGLFNERHRNKLGLSLDLAAPEGKAILEKLVALADVLLVNFRARMLDNLGLDYPVLQEINPQLILVLMPGFGVTGPYKDLSAFGTTIEAITGATELTGYPDDLPLMSGITWPDPVSGLLAAGAILAALRERGRTGHGRLIELSQMEVAVGFLGAPILDYAVNGRLQGRAGNRHNVMAPHGVYRCRGEDEWLALSIWTDAQWRALAGALGGPELASAPRFATRTARLRRRDELDARVEAWTREQDRDEAAERLRAAGVPAAPVRRHAELMADAHLAARRFFETVAHPETGSFPYQAMAGFRLERTPGHADRPAPMFGQHNDYVLRELLGLDAAEVADLAGRQVISDRPLTASPLAL
jgi:crotonobetainyl-CoA:carnitine CoA-transferase CaiB-like acyl-CoA transferase